MKLTIPLATAICLWTAIPAFADDWSFWRGPHQTGVSDEKNLPDRWSPNPKDPNNNLVWNAPYGGRTTPIIQNGRVYFINDSGEKENEQERVMCLDADTGKLIWEFKFNVFHTDIVSDRVGWTNMVGDPETGNVYAHGVQGLLYCFDKDGKVVWSHSLTEEYGRISGYGGRTTSPIVDGDLLIISMLNSSWGEYARGGCRFVAFDKKTGAVVWWSETGFQPRDTYYSCPVVANIKGQRLLISGGGDGGVHAFKVATGEKVWSYIFGGGAVNCSPVVDGNYIYIGHGDENSDTNVAGRVICLDAAQVTEKKPKLLWEKTGIKVKFSSPIFHEGRLYVCDDVAKLYCLDAKNGKQLWSKSYGRNGMGSAVLADGKIYVGAVNSQFTILKPEAKSCQILHKQFFPSKTGADVEINGSPAVANGRVYFMTNEETYCIGKKGAQANAAARGPEVSGLSDRSNSQVQSDGEAKYVRLQVFPADVVLHPGEQVSFKARLFDANGNFLREAKPEWKLAPMLHPPPVPGAKPPPSSSPAAPPPALQGEITPDGVLTVAKAPPGQFGGVIATAEGLAGRARVRVAPVLPYRQDFEKIPVDRSPGGWVNTQGKFAVREKDGSKVLVKLATNPSPLVARANAFLGMPDLTNYTIQCDVMGTKKKNDMADVGVVANRYTLMLAGNIQKLRLISWDALPRVDRTIAFPWKPDAWYTMKLMVDVQGDKAIARGKVWPRGQTEPAEWMVEVEDSTPNKEGSPALYGLGVGFGEDNLGTEIYYDNVSITPNGKK
jgi:outer membrane protein assembly factor BamB